jgi:hypothetical protein
VLLRSNGEAVACGHPTHGRCNIPDSCTLFRAKIQKYLLDKTLKQYEGVRVLQLVCRSFTDQYPCFSCTVLSGEEGCRVAIHGNDIVSSLLSRIAEEMATVEQSLKIVLPNGRLLQSCLFATRIQELVDDMKHYQQDTKQTDRTLQSARQGKHRELHAFLPKSIQLCNFGAWLHEMMCRLLCLPSFFS